MSISSLLSGCDSEKMERQTLSSQPLETVAPLNKKVNVFNRRQRLSDKTDCPATFKF
jgi:hypothetical protein